MYRFLDVNIGVLQFLLSTYTGLTKTKLLFNFILNRFKKS